jgi:hypothetical protein
MVEYIGKKEVKCQHSVSSLSFVLLVPTFLVDSSTKPQEKKMPLALIKKTAHMQYCQI